MFTEGGKDPRHAGVRSLSLRPSLPELPPDMLRALPLAALLLVLGCSSTDRVAAQASPPATAAPTDVPGPPPVERPRNVILMIADGFGPASATLGRGLKGAPLAADPYLVGSVETSATDSRVTDSASSATAYACGAKTYNGAIGVLPDGAACRTVLEAAAARGLATGLVATSRITHATPASFASHVPQRADEAEIAAQLAAAGVDLLFGGGRPLFADRADGQDLVAGMRAAGATVALDRAGYDALDSVPAVALLSQSHLAYEVDRDETDQPSLAEMTTRAIDLLADSPGGRAEGFFLVVEGSRIDHAAHGNDPVGHGHDILAFDAAVEAAYAFARRDGTTLVVATADHETGGLTLGRDGIYAWDPDPIRRATMSAERLAERLADAGPDATAVLLSAFGDVEVEADQLVRIEQTGDPAARVGVFRDLVSERAGVGWTTGGHSAVDVGLYAFGPGAERFAGAMPNDAVGRALFEALGLER